MTTLAPPAARKVPPGPKGQFLFGSIPDVQRDTLGFYLRSLHEYGDVVRFPSLLRHLSWYGVWHPDGVEHVLRANWRNYHKGIFYDTLKSLVGNGLLTSEGDFWLRQRRLAAPAFHHERLKGFATLMTNVAETLATQWEQSARSGAPRDVNDDMMGLTLEIVGRALFDVDLSDEADTIGQAMDIALAHVNYRSMHPFTSPPEWLPTPGNRRYRRALQLIDGTVERIIAGHRQTGEDRGDLLSMLLAARDEETGEGMSHQQILDEVKTLVLAGHETTANALTWTWYLLSLHPNVAHVLHDELSSALGGRTPTLADLPHLPYTLMVLKESMRLYPPAVSVARTPYEDDEILGFHISAGVPVALSTYVTHRHPDFWDNPEGFDPDRFRPEKEEARHRFAYFPFGGGPRLCIGNRFAMMEAHLVLATLAQRFRPALLPGHPVKPEVAVTLRPRHGVRMTIHPW